MLKRFLFTAIPFIVSLVVYGTEEPLVVPSNLKTVTVYRSGAELTHNSSVQLMRGNQELVVEGLSNNIDINSVQISCPSAVTIMGVEFSSNFLVVPEVSARIQLLQDSAERIQKELDRISVQIQTTIDLLDVLKSNRDIKGQQTGLSVTELMKLMNYYQSKSTELQNELALQRDKQKKTSDLLAKMRTQIREEESKNTRTAGQLKLQLSVAATGRYEMVISYITPNAWWTPCYDIRVDDIKSPLKVIYKAKLVQTTGIDWKKVKLSLSTSVPSQWGSAPVLKSWFLTYINPVHILERSLSRPEALLQGSVPGMALNKTSNLEEVSTGYGVKGRGGRTENVAEPLYVVNGGIMTSADYARLDPSSIKSIQVLKDGQATSIYGARGANGVVVVTLKDGLEDYVSVSDNELNVTFDIDLPYDVPTNGKEQTATLKEYAQKALYQYYAVPRLDKDAYLLAEVPDWEKLNLLPGDANIIVEGTYVGKSFIDPASTLDTLNLTLGRDKRVVIKKDKLIDYSSTRFLGSSKVQRFAYELTVKNNKKDSVHMNLKDQYPLSTNKDIEVELVDNGGASVNGETGVLAWKLDLAPGEVKKVRFSYSVRYPKEKLLNLN